MLRTLPSSYKVSNFDQLAHLSFFSCDSATGESFVLDMARLYSNYDINLNQVTDTLRSLGHDAALNHPYHNFIHGLRVGIVAFHIALNDFGAHVLNLPNDLRLILVAALFHDAGHTGGVLYPEGKQPDSVNIARAEKVFRQVNEKLGLVFGPDVEEVVSLINSTLYPSPRDTRPLHRSLQDADLLSMLWPDRDAILAGLCIEQNMNISFDENLEFLEGLGYTTTAGKRLLSFIRTKPWALPDGPLCDISVPDSDSDSDPDTEIVGGGNELPTV